MALPLVRKELEKKMMVWSDALVTSGKTISVDTQTDLGDEYDEQTEQMAYRGGKEVLLNICKNILKQNPEAFFRLEAEIEDEDSEYWVEEQANYGTSGFTYRRTTHIGFPDIDDMEEHNADVDLDEVDPDDYSMLEAVLTVTGAYADGKWSFKKNLKCNLV